MENKNVTLENYNLLLNPAMKLIKYPKCYKKAEDVVDTSNYINNRIEVSDFCGFVRYIGKLKHSTDNKNDEDIWVGIEWDDLTRGKHNGTVSGIEYFKATNPKAGSLIKFNKVNFGPTFNEAVNYKYKFHDSDQNELYEFLNKTVESDLFIQANKKRINIELVGKEKAIKKFSQLELIQNVDLAFSYISEIENYTLNPTLALLPRLKELILQKTLLKKWSQFLILFLNFKNLESINFSENILEFDEEFDVIKEKINPENLNLNYLVMNKCKLNISTIIKISFVMKRVENLYLMGNEINEDTYFADKEFIDSNKKILEENLSHVNFLSLEKNKIRNFLKVYNIICAFNLGRINLNQNHINKIIIDEEDILVMEKFKKNVQYLYLDFNQFANEKEFFTEFSLLENLVDLDILNNSVFNIIGIEKAKCELIGRLLKLQTLNNTSIPKEVRKDFEIFYLKNSCNQYLKENSITSNSNFNKEHFEKYMNSYHPNYFLLKKKYFDPLEDFLENIQQVDLNTIKGNIIEVNFKYGDKKITKKFPKSTTFSNLKNLLSKLFKISDHFSFYIDDTELIDDETKTLDNYSLNSNHIIYLK